MRRATVYTDGACTGNPGPGGWAAIIKFADGHERELVGGNDYTTNNRMEIMGVLESLRRLNEPHVLDIYTDSRYVFNSITKGWIYAWRNRGWTKVDGQPAMNADLWDEVLHLLEVHETTFHWIKGHNGHYYNERCDRLAFAESQRRLMSLPPDKRPKPRPRKKG